MLLLNRLGGTQLNDKGDLGCPALSWVQLYADGKLKERVELFCFKNNWTHTFGNLPKSEGKEILSIE